MQILTYLFVDLILYLLVKMSFPQHLLASSSLHIITSSNISKNKLTKTTFNKRYISSSYYIYNSYLVFSQALDPALPSTFSVLLKNPH